MVMDLLKEGERVVVGLKERRAKGANDIGRAPTLPIL